MTQIIDGKRISSEIKDELAAKVAAYKENGHVASPGFRPAQIQNSPEHNYWIDSKEHYEFGFDDEEFVKELWNKRDGTE